jgi:spore coat polysaccharide biosynthesis predicted glycosyltransferase SpsG
VADAGAAVGLGHLMRCRALVEAIREALQRSGGRMSATFAGRYDRAQERRIRAWGYAIAVERKMGRPSPDLVILDAYRPLAARMSAARAAGAHIVLFDDGHHGPRPAVDVRLIPNRIPNRISSPSTRSPRSGCLDLVGPRYLCLRPEVGRERRRERSGRRERGTRSRPGTLRDASATRVFVSLGGGRMPGFGRLVEALREARLPVDEWVAAGERAARGAIWGGGRRRYSGGRDSGGGGLKWVSEPGAFARAMAGCAAAVSAAGTTAWELACLGVPAVLVTRAANQVPIARALDRRAALWCRRRVSSPLDALPAVVSALRRLLGDRALRMRLSRAGRSLADGRGAERVARAILRRLGARPPGKSDRVDNRLRSD